MMYWKESGRRIKAEEERDEVKEQLAKVTAERDTLRAEQEERNRLRRARRRRLRE